MVQTSVRTGDRAARIDELRERRAGLVAEGEEFMKSIKKREKKLLDERKRLEAPKALRALTVTWEQDGETITIGPLADVGPAEFMKAVDSIPRSVKAKLDGGKMQRLESLRGELNRLPREYKERKTRIETAIYHCDCQIAKLEEGMGS